MRDRVPRPSKLPESSKSAGLHNPKPKKECRVAMLKALKGVLSNQRPEIISFTFKIVKI